MRLILLITMTLISVSLHASTPVEKIIPINDVYSPLGFDTNDTSEVIIEGILPNLCHRAPITKVVIKGNIINIKVTALSYHESNPYCPELALPFLETVKLGLLNKGKYTILVNGKTQFEKKSKMLVTESDSNAVDDHIYANVDYIEKMEQSPNKVTLKGYNPSYCFVLDEVKFVSNGENTYSVLPKMKQVSQLCPMKMTPFAIEVEVPQSINKSKVLLHVRGMDGNSVNSLYSR